MLFRKKIDWEQIIHQMALFVFHFAGFCVLWSTNACVQCVHVCAVHASHTCSVCELVLLWLLRFSNECHSPHFSPHGFTCAAPPPPSPHFYHLPIPPPPPLFLLLTAAACGSSLLKNGWIIIQTSPLTGALR